MIMKEIDAQILHWAETHPAPDKPAVFGVAECLAWTPASIALVINSASKYPAAAKDLRKAAPSFLSNTAA